MTAYELFLAYSFGMRDFSSADLSRADLREADLSGANLSRADLPSPTIFILARWKEINYE